MINGVLVVNKPVDMTSFQVVEAIKKVIKSKKIGHGGTLDPFASGVLVVLINKATKIADQFLEGNKGYRFVLRLDAETDTLDRTGQVVHRYEGPPVEREIFEGVLERFRGEVEHRTPAYAAARIKGQRLYKLARKGVETERPLKRVTIYRLELISYEWPRAILEMECSKGTYVRQIGADIAREIGAFGHIEKLVRTKSGPFTIEDAWELSEVLDAVREGNIEKFLIPMVDALEHLPAVVMEKSEQVRKLRHGLLDREWEQEKKEEVGEYDGAVRIVTPDYDRLLALWWPFGSKDRKRRLRVLI